MSGYPQPPPPPPPPAPYQPPPPGPAPLIKPLNRPAQQARDGQGQLVFDSSRQPVMVPASGSRGSGITVEANVYFVRVKDFEQKVWFKHQVTILPNRAQTSANVRPPLPPKSRLRKIWREVEQREFDPATTTGFFGDTKPVYDGRFACYTQRPLLGQGATNTTTNIVLPGLGQYGFSVTITNPIPVSLDALKKWLEGGTTSDQEDVYVKDALMALNTVFHHGIALLYPASSATFFISDPQTHQLGRGHEPHALDKGIELWRGFFESVRPCQKGLMLNLDTTSGAFIKLGNAVSWVKQFLPTSNTQAIHANVLRPADRIAINRIFKGVVVTTQVDPSQRSARKQHKIRVGLTRGSARTITFDMRGTVISVEDYFRTHYGRVLLEPDLPCIEVKPGTMFPLELCEINPGTKSNRRLTSAQQLAATAFQTLSPAQRWAALGKIRQNTLQAVTEPRLNEWDVQLAPRMPNMAARKLEPPIVAYARNRQAQPSQGAWRMQRNQDRFVQGMTCSSFAVVLADPRLAGQTSDFLGAFWTGAQGLGMTGPGMASPPRNPALPPQAMHVWDHRPGQGMTQTPVERAQQQISEAMILGGGYFNDKPNLVFYITDKANDPEYNAFKAAAAAMGLASQVIRQTRLAKRNDFQLTINLGMKINGKLGGINFHFVPNTTSGDKRVAGGWLEQHLPLMLAADLTHVQDKPSIASVVMSMDREAMLYQAELEVQGLVEPSAGSPSSRARKNEVIERMDVMVLNLLRAYFRCNGRAPPTSVVMYRDGVSDSEWSAILNREMPLAKSAFETFKTETPQCAAWMPQLTYILCVKRHHLRFFGATGTDNREGRNENIPAGTVIDVSVVDPRAFDWYATAHTGILGTTRPTRYVVLHDEAFPRLSPDDAQSMTNALCHAYQRCNRAVSVPAPTYYADLICTRARAWMPTQLDDAQRSTTGSTTSSEGDAQARLEELGFYRDAMETVKKGLTNFEARQGKKPVQWWL